MTTRAEAFRLAFGAQRNWREARYWALYALARAGRFDDAIGLAEREGVRAGRAPDDAPWTAPTSARPR